MQYDITFHPKWWHKNVGIDFGQHFFDDHAYRIECDMRMRHALYERFGAYGIGEKNPLPRPILGTDLLAAGYVHSEILGCEIRYAPDNSPQVICANLDEEMLDGFCAPPLLQSSSFKRLAKQAEALREKFGRVEPCINLMGVQNIALDLMGEELFVAYYTAPQAVRHLLNEITKTTIELGKFLYTLSPKCSGGVTAIVNKTCPSCYVTSNCSVEMISQQIYEDFLLEHDDALARQFGAFGVHHCGKSMEHVVNAYAMLGERLVFAEAGAGSQVDLVRKALPSVALNARFSPAALLRLSEREIEQEVENLAKQGNIGTNSKFSISCVGIDDNVTDNAIICFLKACKEV